MCAHRCCDDCGGSDGGWRAVACWWWQGGGGDERGRRGYNRRGGDDGSCGGRCCGIGGQVGGGFSGGARIDDGYGRGRDHGICGACCCGGGDIGRGGDGGGGWVGGGVSGGARIWRGFGWDDWSGCDGDFGHGPGARFSDEFGHTGRCESDWARSAALLFAECGWSIRKTAPRNSSLRVGCSTGHRCWIDCTGERLCFCTAPRVDCECV